MIIIENLGLTDEHKGENIPTPHNLNTVNLLVDNIFTFICISVYSHINLLVVQFSSSASVLRIVQYFAVWRTLYGYNLFNPLSCICMFCYYKHLCIHFFAYAQLFTQDKFLEIESLGQLIVYLLKVFDMTCLLIKYCISRHSQQECMGVLIFSYFKSLGGKSGMLFVCTQKLLVRLN